MKRYTDAMVQYEIGYRKNVYPRSRKSYLIIWK